MRFKYHSKLESGRDQIILVPLINVIFLLFIFFVVCSPLVMPSSIIVKLPKALTSDVLQEKNFIITVTSENIIYLNGRVITIKELKNILSRPTSKQMPILIKADRHTSIGRIVDVWDLCRNLGIEKINIATQEE